MSVPAQSPLQPLNDQFAAGVATSWTSVPC